MKAKDGLELVQYEYDFIQSLFLNNEEELTREERMYQHYFAPFADKYFSPQNSICMLGGLNKKFLKLKKVWTLRDGLVPINIFFMLNEPTTDHPRLYIHKDLWFIVPVAWQKHVRFFDIDTDCRFSKNKLPKKIIIMGLANSTLADPEEFDDALNLLVEKIGEKNLKDIEVQAYIPTRGTDLLGGWQKENTFVYARSLFEKIKIDIEFPEWVILREQATHSDTMYYEINRGHFIKDSYSMHHFLSKGAGLLEAGSPNDKIPFVQESKVPLSQFHWMNTYSLDFSQCQKYQDPFSSEYFHYFKKIALKGSESKSLSKHWESWMATYLKQYFSTAGFKSNASAE